MIDNGVMGFKSRNFDFCFSYNAVIPRIVKLVKEGDDRKEITPPNVCHYDHPLVTVGKKIVCSEENCKSISEEFTHSVKEIIFWGIKRPPRSRIS